MLLNVGSEIESNYEILEHCGEGSFGEVYYIKNKILNREEALKIIKLPLLSKQQQPKKLKEAIGIANLLSSIVNPHLIQVFNAGTTKIEGVTYAYYTMEKMNGNLNDYWKSFSQWDMNMPVDQCIDLTMQICKGLLSLHNYNEPLKHGDIKPHNIMIKMVDCKTYCKPFIKISDFGLTFSDFIQYIHLDNGISPFLPPEIYKNEDYKCSGDMWGVGCILYQLLTNELPYGLSENNLSKNKLEACWQNELVLPSSLNKELEKTINKKFVSDLDLIITNALNIDEKTRYKNAELMLRHLKKLETPKISPMTRVDPKISIPPHDFHITSLVEEALEISKNPTKLCIAADLLERAIIRDSVIRKEHSSTLKRWRSTDPLTIEQMAKLLHENYRELHKKALYRHDPVMQPWEELNDELKDSNRRQASRIFHHLNKLDYLVKIVENPEVQLFNPDTIEKIASMEHDCWVYERISEGWTLGPEKNYYKKTSPFLVPWNALSQQDRQWDIDFALSLPPLLAKAGIQIYQI